MIRFKTALWMLGSTAAVALVGTMLHPSAALAQAVKAALVRSVDEPGRAPYQETLNYTLGQSPCPTANSTVCLVEFSQVPAGYRLVIKHVNSVLSTVPNPIAFIGGPYLDARLSVQSTVGTSGQTTSTLVLPHGIFGSLEYPFGGTASVYQADLQVEAYADPMTIPTVTVTDYGLKQGGLANTVTLSGYYVAIP